MHIARGAFAAAIGLITTLTIAGCGSHSSSTQALPSGARTSSAASSPSAAETASVAKKGMATARLIAQALVDHSYTKLLALKSDVAGPVMPSYLQMEALWDEIDAATGSPGQPGTVTSIADGFKICYAKQGGCQSLTDFHWDSAGRITDFEVGGLLISPRLAVGGSYSSSGVTFISVYSYVGTGDGEVNVVFEARNTSGHALGSAKQPAFLPALVTAVGTQLPFNTAASIVTNGPIPSGTVTGGLAVFDTTVFTGQFILRSDTSKEQTLAAATLRKVPAP